MKKYAKIVQSDPRGQIVIPKDVRIELGLEEGAGFYIYIIENEGLFLKNIPLPKLGDNSEVVEKLKKNSSKLKIDPKNIDRSVQSYRRTKRNFEEV